MFTYEIDALLKERNYDISSSEYNYIIDSSPQINHVKYEPYDNMFQIWTSDDGYWKFQVHLEE